MSTQYSTTCKSDTTDLTRSESALISSHWGEITRHLAPPGVAWYWGENRISHKVKYNWKDAGLIHRTPDGRRWRTTEALWCHVVERAADDETVGEEARGQELLPVPDPRGRESVYLVDADTQSRPMTQATLTGDTIRPATVRQLRGDDLATRNAAKDPTTGDRSRDAAQTTLTTATLHDRSQWDVTTDTDASTGITVVM